MVWFYQSDEFMGSPKKNNFRANVITMIIFSKKITK